MIFGQSSAKEIAFMVAGGLVGVAATKYLPSMMPANLTSAMGGGGGIMQVGIFVGAQDHRPIVGIAAFRQVGPPRPELGRALRRDEIVGRVVFAFGVFRRIEQGRVGAIDVCNYSKGVPMLTAPALLR